MYAAGMTLLEENYEISKYASKKVVQETIHPDLLTLRNFIRCRNRIIRNQSEVNAFIETI